MSDREPTGYPPVGTNLRYRRGDGAIVTLSVQLPGEPLSPLVELASLPELPPPPDISALPRLGRGGGAVLEGRVHQGVPAPDLPVLPPLVARPVTDDTVLDDPAIGGQFTIFVLLYGPRKFHEMHRRCLDSIIATVPEGRMDLRIGSNELCDESVTYVAELVARGICSKHYRHVGNDKKYPVMREMFYDPTHPITTKWLIWFDDDSMADVNPLWLQVLAKQIVHSETTGHMFGGKCIWRMQPGQAAHYRTRPWYKGRDFRMRNGQPSPNGATVVFATGGFWCLSTAAMRACDIPDPELQHNGGDYCIGEQLYQGGYELRSFNGHKQYIRTSSVSRRGLSEAHFGAARRQHA